jgi:hypothetical protein
MIELNLNRIDMKPKLSGRIDLSRLPRTLRVLDLTENEFSGVIDWDTLPPFLEELLIGGNKFTCDPTTGFDVSCLSSQLTMIDISSNNFSGPICDFSLLPPRLVYLNASRNRFHNQMVVDDPAVAAAAAPAAPDGDEKEGASKKSSSGSAVDLATLRRRSAAAPRFLPVDLSVAPPLKGLDLSHNDLAGPIDLRALPTTMPVLEDLYLNNNHFTGQAPAAAHSRPARERVARRQQLRPLISDPHNTQHAEN